VCTSIGPFFGFVIMLSFGFLEIFKSKEHPVLGFQKKYQSKMTSAVQVLEFWSKPIAQHRYISGSAHIGKPLLLAPTW